MLEHIGDDAKVLRNFFQLLRPGGHMLLLVPAHPRLYTAMDKTLGHFRRYTRDEVAEKLAAAGFDVVANRGFNRLGTLGWFVSGKLLGRTTLSAGQMLMYERMLPLAKLVERLGVIPPLSIIAVGRKPPSAEQCVPDGDNRPAEETLESVEMMIAESQALCGASSRESANSSTVDATNALRHPASLP